MKTRRLSVRGNKCHDRLFGYRPFREVLSRGRGRRKKEKGMREIRSREGKSGRVVWFLSASRYQAEGGHMKLANVPTCPFPTYRVFPAPCSRVESEREGRGRGGVEGDSRQGGIGQGAVGRQK